MRIKKSIVKEAQKEVDVILKEAKQESQILKDKLIEATDKKADSLLNDAQKEHNKIIKEKQIEFEHQTKTLILEEKNKQIQEVLNKLKTHILNLDDKGLFDYTVKLIKEENIKGNETIRVKKEDYNRYLTVFSTKAKGSVVELDKLNEKLGKQYQLKLENKPAKIPDGFILVGDIYDLNFSVEPLFVKIKRQYEKEIHDILYG